MNKVSKYLNELSDPESQASLKKCCAARQWIDRMNDARPFADDDAVLIGCRADLEFSATGRLAAGFRGASANWRCDQPPRLNLPIPRAGRRANKQRQRAAGGATISRLAELNEEYFQKFGYIFIVCATGKSAEQMLEILESRLSNEPDEELPIAAAEQLKITILRLNKLVDDND